MPAASYARKRGQLLALLGVSLVLVLTVIAWSTYTGHQMTSVYAPTIDAVLEIQSQGTLAHLWLEEHLAGDRDARADDLEALWGQVIALARAVVDGGVTEKGLFNPLPDRHLQVALEEVERSLLLLRDLTGERLSDRIASGSGSETDQLFDAVFDRFLSDAAEVEIRLQEIIDEKQRLFLATQLLLVTLATFLLAGSLTLLLRFLRQREKAEADRERLVHDLAGKNEELEGILSVASHDFRSPLVNIQGFGRELALSCADLEQALGEYDLPDSFKERAAAIFQDDIRHCLNTIEQNAGKMDHLIKGLLKVSRLGRMPLEQRLVDMQHLVQSVVDSMQYQLRRQAASVYLAQLPSCRGDENQLNQVFTNLLDNALKYVDSRRPPEIRIEGRVEGEMCRYILSDNGIGIARDHQNKIFDIFHRLHPDAFAGEGLGLTIVRRIITRLGGIVELESEEGQGCRFHLLLPRGS